ncbi:hypothetical protein ACW9HQ_45875, partial [Nocardia gipuzkoensis]
IPQSSNKGVNRKLFSISDPSVVSPGFSIRPDIAKSWHSWDCVREAAVRSFIRAARFDRFSYPAEECVMYSKLFFARAALVAAGCVATSVVLGGPAQSVPVQPAGSTSVSPAGASVTATSVGSQVLKAGAVTVTCKTLNAKGSVPAAPDNQNANGSVSVQISAPTFSDCETDLAGVNATVTTTGTWAVTVQNGSPITGSLTIPKGGMTIKTS